MRGSHDRSRLIPVERCALWPCARLHDRVPARGSSNLSWGAAVPGAPSIHVSSLHSTSNRTRHTAASARFVNRPSVRRFERWALAQSISYHPFTPRPDEMPYAAGIPRSWRGWALHPNYQPSRPTTKGLHEWILTVRSQPHRPPNIVIRSGSPSAIPASAPTSHAATGLGSFPRPPRPAILCMVVRLKNPRRLPIGDPSQQGLQAG